MQWFILGSKSFQVFIPSGFMTGYALHVKKKETILSPLSEFSNSVLPLSNQTVIS
uniref:Uncharacterized protein n=1 Tax=Arundo donax TaxID=35708 RepID=A0A0A8ZHC0_ARUDO